MGGRSKATNNSEGVQESTGVVTSILFEAFLACPTKCYLLSKGEVCADNAYTTWAIARAECFRYEGIQNLTAHAKNLDHAWLETDLWKTNSWHFALGKTVRAQNWEASPHLIQRIQQKATASTSQFVPVRFVPDNKLSTSDKMIAAFEALVLSKSLGTKIGVAKIVHGDKWSSVTVKANTLSRAVHRTVGQASVLLSASSPPDLILSSAHPAIYDATQLKPTVRFQSGTKYTEQPQDQSGELLFTHPKKNS